MAHLHDLKDDDELYVLDEDLNITLQGEVKGLKRGDHKSEIKTFIMPRYCDGHDMTLCDKVEVHYNNINYNAGTRSAEQNKGFDEVQGYGVCEDDENMISFTWLIQGDAAELDGTLDFCFRFACMNGEVIEYQKFSGTFSGVPVGSTICNTEHIAKEYADVLAAWKIELLKSIGELEERISAIDKGVSSARISEVILLSDRWVGEDSPYSQIVTIDGVTENSQVDLTPDAEQLEIFRQKELTFTTKNVGGIVTVYAVGQKPANDYTIQVTITEVRYG